MGCIDIYYNPVKNTMTNVKEQLIEYGQRLVIDWEKLLKPCNLVMYYLADRPERAFVAEELMLIPEDTELPPDYVQTW